ncbi:MAG TPA: YigZ family protein [Polyangiaceae bacterium]|nr:YigZ family protein [Polyangiaceae bacterium]
MLTIPGRAEYEEEVKKSRFLARAARVESAEEASSFLHEVRDTDATHNCWAWRIGDQYRFSDDGEPGGTAGRPILGAIDGQQVDHVMVVVTRWFGGIKLGAGGLVRAYGGTAAECLRRAGRLEVRPKIHVGVAVPFDQIGAVYPVIERHQVRKLSESYTDGGVSLELEVEEAGEEGLRQALRDATRGRVVFAQGADPPSRS